MSPDRRDSARAGGDRVARAKVAPLTGLAMDVINNVLLAALVILLVAV
jgi:hypothetical protein